MPNDDTDVLTLRNWRTTPTHDAVRQYEKGESGAEKGERDWNAVRVHHRRARFVRQRIRFPHIERAIEDASSLTDMPAGWDDDGAAPISEETWRRAGNTLRRIAGTAQRRYRYLMPAPAIGPCADGSIDLYWNGPGFTLLINIKEQEQGCDYYWEHEGSKSQGPFNPEIPDLSFLGSLVRP